MKKTDCIFIAYGFEAAKIDYKGRMVYVYDAVLNLMIMIAQLRYIDS